MYDIGENDAVFEEEAAKRKQRKQEKDQKKQAKEQKKLQRKQNVQNIYEVIKDIKAKSAELKNTGTVKANKKMTGKFSDICQVDNMNCSEVKNYCSNDEIYKATQQNIVNARDAGYLTIDENKDIHLTDKGHELTQSESFVKQFEQDQLSQSVAEARSQSQDYGYVEFNGTEQDMGVFNYTEQVDINSIKDCPEKETVLKNFSKLENQGMVNIYNGVITPTENGAKFAKTQNIPVKQASNTELTNVIGDLDADGLPDKIDSQYSYLEQSSNNAKGALQSGTGEKAAGGVGKEIGGKAASNTSAATAKSAGTKVAGSVAKTAGSAAGTAAKTGASTTTTGAAAAGAGAATAGVGTVVVVAAQAVTQAVKQVKNTVHSMVQNLSNNG